MNLAVIGSGGREHAICYKLSLSKKISKLIFTNLPFLTVEQLKINEIEKNINKEISFTIYPESNTSPSAVIDSSLIVTTIPPDCNPLTDEIVIYLEGNEEDLENEVMVMAKKIADGPPIAIRLSKLMLYKGLEFDLETAMKMAAAAETITLSSKDHLEGAEAFREKRNPEYRGH